MTPVRRNPRPAVADAHTDVISQDFLPVLCCLLSCEKKIFHIGRERSTALAFSGTFLPDLLPCSAVHDRYAGCRIQRIALSFRITILLSRIALSIGITIRIFRIALPIGIAILLSRIAILVGFCVSAVLRIFFPLSGSRRLGCFPFFGLGFRGALIIFLFLLGVRKLIGSPSDTGILAQMHIPKELTVYFCREQFADLFQ